MGLLGLGTGKQGTKIVPGGPKGTIKTKAGEVVLLDLTNCAPKAGAGCDMNSGTSKSISACMECTGRFVNTFGGKGPTALAPGNSMGNRYWSDGVVSCNSETGSVQAGKYFNNVPTKSNPFGQSTILGALIHQGLITDLELMLSSLFSVGAENCRKVSVDVDYVDENGSRVQGQESHYLTCSNFRQYSKEMWTESGLSAGDYDNMNALCAGGMEGMTTRRKSERLFHGGMAFLGLYILARILLPRIDNKRR